MIQTPNVRSAKIIVVVITGANFAIAICTGSVLLTMLMVLSWDMVLTMSAQIVVPRNTVVHHLLHLLSTLHQRYLPRGTKHYHKGTKQPLTALLVRLRLLCKQRNALLLRLKPHPKVRRQYKQNALLLWLRHHLVIIPILQLPKQRKKKRNPLLVSLAFLRKNAGNHPLLRHQEPRKK